MLKLLTIFLKIPIGVVQKYFADKYTDKRRAKESAEEQKKLWKEIENRFPDPISEMRLAFSDSKNKNIRLVSLIESGNILTGKPETSIGFYTDKIPEFRPAFLFLEKHGFLSKINDTNIPMFKVDELLVDRLTTSSKPFWKFW